MIKFIKYLLFFVFLTAPVLASEINDINEIKVEGLQRISYDTVLSYGDLSIEKLYSDDLTNNAIKKLYDTQLFSDISIKYLDNILTINVKENPTINLVLFDGNKSKKDEDLASEIKLKERSVFSRSRVKEDVKRLLELYQRSGRLAAKIDPSVELLDNNRINLIFKIDEFKSSGKKILFEGAQGILLDVDHGTYPYVTSSNTVASAASTGTGCGPNTINYVLGITKAYTTRVGEGPFPTELKDKTGELLGSRGKEFGTVTSRKRRCGWFDGVLVRQTIKISGINGIALTKLDVLDELDEIKMCIEYDLNGKKLDYLPASPEDQFNIKPIYKTFPGWRSSTQGVRNIKDLPEKAKNYIYALEDFIGAKISSISTSPEREDTILIEDPFKI